MQFWKFLLIGISGDLAHRKILPGLAQFAQVNQEFVSIDLIGFARSHVETKDIETILTNSVEGPHHINSINLIQGDYQLDDIISETMATLQEGEKLIVYMAVPPQVFLDLIAKSCPYNSDPLHILVEKPFGTDYGSAQDILQKIRNCKLGAQVHFCDHYAFKTSSILDKQEIQGLDFLDEKTLTRISITALEEVDVSGRGGYYDQNGAIKDMFPAHMLTLFNIAKQLHPSLREYSFDRDIEINNVITGQYKTFIHDVQNHNSKTESYFRINGTMPNDCIIEFESGKKLGKKQTEIALTYETGETLTWNIDPSKTLELTQSTNSFFLNLNRNTKTDHTNIFEYLLTNKTSRFIDDENVIAGWNVYERILKFIQDNTITPILYQNNKYPIEKI